MSLVTRGIGLAKAAKRRGQAYWKQRTPVYLSPVRRIERVRLPERICAMTFDDGPSRLPANPGGDRPLTLLLAETLESFHARGTFDVVGDTSGNYPDQAGKHGSASWGGRHFDHYPDFGRDEDGGAAHCPELIQRLLDGGHEITSHTYAHILWGRKALVYGQRTSLGSLDKVTEDLQRLHTLLKDRYDYTIRLGRPPHYVDRIQPPLNSYDAYALMGYQYLAASFDGAGWLPLSSYEAEVEATWRPLEQALGQHPDALAGQIIFQKDGCNMARRTPIAHGLPRQLELLQQAGYQVVTVSSLLEKSPFADLGPGDAGFDATRRLLERGLCPAYRDNTVRLQQPVTRGELVMLFHGWKGAPLRISQILNRQKPIFSDLPVAHPYAGAAAVAAERGALQTGASFQSDTPADAALLDGLLESAGATPAGRIPESRRGLLELLAERL